MVVKRSHFTVPSEAVGLLLVEMLCPLRILKLCVFYFLVTVIFAATWWAIKGDMSGAFGAGAYLMSFLTIVALVVTIIVSYRDR